MPGRAIICAWFAAFVAGFTACGPREDGTVPSYFGQPTPDLEPALFAPGLVSTDAIELNAVFTPDMREFFCRNDRQVIDFVAPPPVARSQAYPNTGGKTITTIAAHTA